MGASGQRIIKKLFLAIQDEYMKVIIINYLFFRYAPVGVFPGYPHPNSHHPYMPWTPHPAEHPIPAVFVHPGHPDYPHPHAQVDGHPSQGHSSHQGRAESVSSSDSGSSKKGSKVRKNII